ncbi:MAG: GAF domain-containing sensor histidine kinase [Chloroflexota bacterium]
MNFTSPAELPDLKGLDLRPALEETCRLLLELSTARQVLVYARQSDSTLYDPLYALGSFSRPEKAAFWSTSPDMTTDLLAEALHRSLKPLWINDEKTRRSFRASILAALQGQSYLALTLHNRSQPLGFLLLGWEEAGIRLAEDRLALLMGLARTLALALDNARLYELASQQVFQAIRLQEIGAAILQQIELNEVLALVASGAMQLTSATGCILRLQEQTGRLTTVHQSGNPPLLSGDDWQPVQMLGRREPLLLNLRPQPPLNTGDTALLALPLPGENGQAMGVLELYHKRRYLSAADLQIARSFAAQAAIAIQHARLYRRIQQTAVAEERARLARDLHDSISQALYAASLYTRAAERQLKGGNLEAVQTNLDEIGSTLRSALTELRLLIFELRPPVLEQAGLSGALYHRLKSVEERAGIQVEWHSSLNTPLPRRVEENLYRIAQEALNNSLKHARAGQISLRLEEQAGLIRLRIADNGVGFSADNPTASGMGLRIMQERAAQINARLKIESAPGAGTVILVEVAYGDDSHPAGG